jgi:hypothetical protein
MKAKSKILSEEFKIVKSSEIGVDVETHYILNAKDEYCGFFTRSEKATYLCPWLVATVKLPKDISEQAILDYIREHR